MADSSSSFYNPELVAEQAVVMNMIQKCSVSEIEEVEDSGSCDLLSDLPLGIIHIILGLIPIKEAVRTSVLSTQWRYTWTTLPHLEFDDRCATEEEFEKFITRVLFRHQGPIHKFTMSRSCDFEDLDELILCLSRNDIRELLLDTDLDYEGVVKMHSSIYSCKKLTNLRLYGYELDPPPLNFKGFLFLRFLSLENVGLSPDEVYSLVALCPNLENFKLTDYVENLELKISAPNLKYMSFGGCHEKICISAPLLTDISVYLTDYRSGATYEELRSSACDYAKCFGGLTILQKLSGFDYFTKYLSLGIELCHQSLVFHHLKSIHLVNVNSKDAKEMMVVAYLVIGAPNLQELKIIAQIKEDDEPAPDVEAPHLSFKDLGCASNFKSEKLSVVYLFGAKGLTVEVELLKFLIQCSPALERMDVYSLYDTKEKWNNLRAKLEGCNWASPTVQLCNLR